MKRDGSIERHNVEGNCSRPQTDCEKKDDRPPQWGGCNQAGGGARDDNKRDQNVAELPGYSHDRRLGGALRIREQFDLWRLTQRPSCRQSLLTSSPLAEPIARRRTLRTSRSVRRPASPVRWPTPRVASDQGNRYAENRSGGGCGGQRRLFAFLPRSRLVVRRADGGGDGRVASPTGCNPISAASASRAGSSSGGSFM